LRKRDNTFSSTVQREISIDTFDLVVLVDIPRDLAIGHKIPV
jgi:hypothetical protein